MLVRNHFSYMRFGISVFYMDKVSENYLVNTGIILISISFWFGINSNPKVTVANQING